MMIRCWNHRWFGLKTFVGVKTIPNPLEYFEEVIALKSMHTYEYLSSTSGVRRGGGVGGFEPPPEPEKIVVEK